MGIKMKANWNEYVLLIGIWNLMNGQETQFITDKVVSIGPNGDKCHCYGIDWS